MSKLNYTRRLGVAVAFLGGAAICGALGFMAAQALFHISVAFFAHGISPFGVIIYLFFAPVMLLMACVSSVGVFACLQNTVRALRGHDDQVGFTEME